MSSITVILQYYNETFILSTSVCTVHGDLGPHVRPRLHEDDVKRIDIESYLSGKKSFGIGLVFTQRHVSANFEDDTRTISGNVWT